MILYDKFLEQFPNFKDRKFESKYDVAKELSIYNDEHILNYSDFDILQLSNEIISKLELKMDDFDIPNLSIIEAVNLYKYEPGEFYEKYSELLRTKKDKDNFTTWRIWDTEERAIEIVIDKSNGNVVLWDEFYRVLDDFDIEMINAKSVDDFINGVFAIYKFEINNIDDLYDALETTDNKDAFEFGWADCESEDELVDLINEELKELGFKTLTKSNERTLYI